jgi:hypothetical protein
MHTYKLIFVHEKIINGNKDCKILGGNDAELI